MLHRFLAIVVGLGLLCIAAHANIAFSGGYGTPTSYITLGLAAGVAIGAITIGKAWSENRFALSFAILIALLMGEAYGLASTAERIIAVREDTQMPLVDALAARNAATQQVAQAETALAVIGQTTPRIAAALEAKEAAVRAAREKSTEKGCAANCANILIEQTKSADTELAEARKELAERAMKATAAIETARKALSALPTPRSATPLADKLRVAPWIIDLVMAAIASIGLNGLAACLLAYGAHQTARRKEEAPAAPLILDDPSPALVRTVIEPTTAMPFLEPPRSEPRRSVPVKLKKVSADRQANAFAIACVRPSEPDHVFLTDLTNAYKKWCADVGEEPLDETPFADAMTGIFKEAGLTGAFISGRPAIKGIKLILSVAIAA